MSKTKFRISGIGCALVDYLYKPVDFSASSFLRYKSVSKGDGGLLPGILVFKDELEKFSGEDYFGIRKVLTENRPPVALNIGGPCIVALIHAAQMLTGTVAEVYFYGSKGNDEGADFIDDGLRQTPLKIGKYKRTEQYTPFTDVLYDPAYDHGNGERIFINNIGSAWDLYPEDLDDDFFNSDITVFGATALVPHIHASLLVLLKRSKENGAFTIVTTVYDSLNEKKNADKSWPMGESVDTYRYVDLLVMDMEEALRLSGQSGIEQAFSFFKSVGVGAVVVTHGAKPTHYYAGSPLFVPAEGTMPVSELVRKKLSEQPEQTGDTTGCGDNFAGGVISSVACQLIENSIGTICIKEAIAFGTVSGGYACFYHGGTFFEQYAGEKKELILPYYDSYKEQLNSKN